MSQFKNDLLLRAAKGENVERVPVWLMRQAGRILPEYRAVRAKAKNFIEFVKTSEMAAEVTVQPVDILGVDAAIIFSDILVIPEAMGLPYQMIEAKGPHFEKTITSQSDVNALKISDGSNLQYVYDAIRLSKKQLNNRVPLIGFCGAPWTLLAYMVEGNGSKTFSKAKKFLYTQPKLAHQTLEKITQSSINYLKGQVEAGADLIQIFDSWAGVLSPEMHNEFSLRYMSAICDELSKQVPVTIFAKDAHFALSEIKNTKCSVVGIDWNTNPQEARKNLGNRKTLQGNADPCLLYADFDVIKKETKKMLDAFGPQNYIANLGHGLYPDTEKEKVKFFIDCVKQHTFQVAKVNA
ncbi:MAG TPA: uroporphyrinogen decarboxylase [Bacteroidia bacterium]|jgi:uroporphyrinogen decarboxylase|nr:uroporphyrinogen decarboxylase [Bacteroidia bacterium]